MLIMIAIAFVLAWSSLVWAVATSNPKSDEKHGDWPNYWRVQLLVMLVPMLVVLGYGFLPTELKPEIPVLQGALYQTGLTVVQPLALPVIASDTASNLNWLNIFIVTGIAAYLLGVVLNIYRFVASKHRIATILNAAEYHPILRVWVTKEDVSPFAVSTQGGRVIFPEALLLALSPEQVQLVIAHENTHLKYNDPKWAERLFLLRAIFWFNPFLRDVIRRWHVAIELRSDSAALEDASAPTRKAYAQCLIKALQFPADKTATVSASFSHNQIRSEKMRIKNIIKRAGQGNTRQHSAMQLIAMATAFTLIGCTSAASLSMAADDDRRVAKEERSIVINGENYKNFEELSPEQRAEVEAQLAEAEIEIEKAMREVGVAEEEIAETLAELEVELRDELGLAQIEMEIVEKEMARARVEIERAKEEMREAREEIRAERERLAKEGK